MPILGAVAGTGGATSVWPNYPSQNPPLAGSEGDLVSVTVCVEPRLLEDLLEALAELPFPINPQIYHNAAVAHIYADGREEVEPTTMVEFPAYAGRLGEVREVLQKYGFGPGSLCVKNMLDDIHSHFDVQPAPPGAPYTKVIRYKQAVPAS